MLRKADLLLAAALVLLSLAALLLPGGGGSGVVVVRQDGREVYRGAIDIAHRVELPGNTVQIAGGEVWMEHADCAGQDCVRMGKIRQGQIACIPNNVIVSLEQAQSEVDSIAN